MFRERDFFYHCVTSAIKAEELKKVEVSENQLVNAELTKLLDNEYKEYLKIWALHEQSSWDYIRLTEAYYLEEWRLLERVRKDLRKGWRRVYSTLVSETKNRSPRKASRSQQAVDPQVNGCSSGAVGSTDSSQGQGPCDQ